jgi:hypothetical protein
MHGHRHIDWISRVRRSAYRVRAVPCHASDRLDNYFYAHIPAMSADGKQRLLQADRIDLPGQQIADVSSATQTESEFVGDNAPGDPAQSGPPQCGAIPHVL